MNDFCGIRILLSGKIRLIITLFYKEHVSLYIIVVNDKDIKELFYFNFFKLHSRLTNLAAVFFLYRTYI